jgi:hypothetical protein
MQEDKIRAALVELLYRNSYGVVVANILISLAAAYVLVGCPGTACSSRSAARETQNIELTTACRWKSATTATPPASIGHCKGSARSKPIPLSLKVRWSE